MNPADWITDEQIAYFRARYQKTWKHSLAQATLNANAFAEKHAPKAVQGVVARLHLAFGMLTDAGDKKLVMLAIDEAIAYGRFCDEHADS